jgi:hypothetical protein
MENGNPMTQNGLGFPFGLIGQAETCSRKNRTDVNLAYRRDKATVPDQSPERLMGHSFAKTDPFGRKRLTKNINGLA